VLITSRDPPQAENDSLDLVRSAHIHTSPHLSSLNTQDQTPEGEWPRWQRLPDNFAHFRQLVDTTLPQTP